MSYEQSRTSVEIKLQIKVLPSTYNLQILLLRTRYEEIKLLMLITMRKKKKTGRRGRLKKLFKS